MCKTKENKLFFLGDSIFHSTLLLAFSNRRQFDEQKAVQPGERHNRNCETHSEKLVKAVLVSKPRCYLIGRLKHLK